MEITKQIYVALFRGINVGGNNLIDMKQLKSEFESMGFTNVVTFINSGNVIFEAAAKSQAALPLLIEKMVKKEFNLDLKILVKSLENIESIAAKLPAKWVKDKTMRTDIMFLWEGFDSPKIIHQLNLNTVDNLKYAPGAILWNILDKDYSQSAMPKIIGTKLYKNMTVRNANTFRKIQEIMKDLKDKKL